MTVISSYDDAPKFDFSDFIVTKFYHYAAYVNDIVFKYDPVHYDKPRGDKMLEELYNHFAEVADAYLIEYTGRKYSSLSHQNKTVIEITSIKNHVKLYIGRCDGVYNLGYHVEESDSYGCDEFKINRK